jgi:cytochrome subunit of sulfide dehydrogenase
MRLLEPYGRHDTACRSIASEIGSLDRSNRGCNRHALRSGETVNRILVVVLIAALPRALAKAESAAVDPGASLAATCANCHGTNGVSVGIVESLAAKPKDDIARKMRDFKSGARPGTVMPQLAKGYTDEQIELLAAWLAAQKPTRQ